MGSHVYMIKHCPEHGTFTSMVERSPQWYSVARPPKDPCRKPQCCLVGLVVNVTSACNISCRGCYHDGKGGHRPVDDIVRECYENRDKAPFGLAGGEPTIHPEIVDIVKQIKPLAAGSSDGWNVPGEVNICTNGIKLVENPKLFTELIGAGMTTGDVLNMGLSFHEESGGKDLEFLELCRAVGLKLRTTFALIRDLSDIDQYVDIYREYRDVIASMRIHALTTLWAGKGTTKIFTSDMLAYFANKGPVSFVENAPQRVSLANIVFDGMHFCPVSWYDKWNVDLDDRLFPKIVGKDGKIHDLVSGLILNEREA